MFVFVLNFSLNSILVSHLMFAKVFTWPASMVLDLSPVIQTGDTKFYPPREFEECFIEFAAFTYVSHRRIFRRLKESCLKKKKLSRELSSFSLQCISDKALEPSIQ